MGEQTTAYRSTSLGDVSGSTIGAIGFAHDVAIFAHSMQNASLPDDVKSALIDALRTVEKLDLSQALKDDVAGDLAKIASELQKGQPDEGRLRHLLRSIKDVAAPVASALSIATSLTKLLGE